LTEVKNGTATIEDLQKLNALLDMQSDMEAAQYDAAKAKN
jgi:hypothetical protein